MNRRRFALALVALVPVIGCSSGSSTPGTSNTNLAGSTSKAVVSGVPTNVSSSTTGSTNGITATFTSNGTVYNAVLPTGAASTNFLNGTGTGSLVVLSNLSLGGALVTGNQATITSGGTQVAVLPLTASRAAGTAALVLPAGTYTILFPNASYSANGSSIASANVSITFDVLSDGTTSFPDTITGNIPSDNSTVDGNTNVNLNYNTTLPSLISANLFVDFTIGTVNLTGAGSGNVINFVKRNTGTTTATGAIRTVSFTVRFNSNL